MNDYRDQGLTKATIPLQKSRSLLPNLTDTLGLQTPGPERGGTARHAREVLMDEALRRGEEARLRDPRQVLPRWNL